MRISAIVYMDKLKCPECGGDSTVKAGYYMKRCGKMQQLRCTKCGRTFKSGEVVPYNIG